MKRFKLSTEVLFSEDAIDALLEEKDENAVLITDKFMVDSGMADMILKKLSNCKEVSVFSEVVPDPPMDLIERGSAFLQDKDCDIVVALGGGSSIDAAKAIVYMAKKIEEKQNPDNQKKIKLIALPTTSGTGSEATSFAVVNDTEAHVKYPLISDSLTADEAILDADLVRSVPPAITADTGMDVLTHAIESYVSINHNEFTSALAEKSIEICGVYLYRAYVDGNDMHARQKMHVASCLAGLSFNAAGLGITHSMAHQLGAIFHIPHGRANAMLLPHIVEYNANINKRSRSQKEYLPAVKRYSNIAHLLGLSNYNEVMSVRSLVNWIQFMQKEMNIPLTIEEMKTITPDAYFAAVD